MGRSTVSALCLAILISGCGGGGTSGTSGTSGTTMVSVPNVVGSTQAAATTSITGAGLTVGAVTMQSSSTVASGNVISENPAAGASVASGSAVALVVSTGGSGSAAAWTWESGANTVNAAGVYGTQGVAAASNVPGARDVAVSWTDTAGDLWLFGGYRDASGNDFNDLWRYELSDGQWTWVGGAMNDSNTAPTYGTQGVAAASNNPGARDSAVSWTDTAGNLWLFGGEQGYQSTDVFQNDLWRYSPSTGLWTWVSGLNTANASGVYGTQEVAAAANVPGARGGAVSWMDAAGNLWLFGGRSYDSTGSFGVLNDLWRYSPSTGLWTWISGSNTAADASAVYGTQGVAAATNVPGGRGFAVSWTDSASNLWLFGGFPNVNSSADLNDLWRFTPGTGQWTWVSGANTTNAPGVYGTQGVAAASNVPGARDQAVSWTDSAGNLWLFGGEDAYSNGSPGVFSDHNDLWRY